jgi:predicted nucleic acid-binding protein
MILVDTNVVSETMRRLPDVKVVAWLISQASATLHLSAISLAELVLGIAVMPNGRRKTELGLAMGERALRLFAERILAFDEAAASAYASVISRARASGRPISMAGGQIAAIAITHGLTVATRDAAPFEAAGLPVINPWNDGD